MDQTGTQTIPRDKFLTMAANLLHRAFLDTSRTQAKTVFRDISQGKVVHLTNVKMEDGSTLRFEIELDHSELTGKLNYGAFRASVATLVHNLGEALQSEAKEIMIFNAENEADVNIFGVTAVTVEDEQPRVMVLGADTSSRRESILLRLMYLSPEQFLANDESAEQPV